VRARLRPFAQPEFQMSLPLLREQLLIPNRNVADLLSHLLHTTQVVSCRSCDPSLRIGDTVSPRLVLNHRRPYLHPSLRHIR
jgi:hypothetical protein